MRYLELPGVRQIKHLLADDEISEIMINGPQRLFVEKGGAMLQIDPVFASESQIDVLIENLLQHTGRAVTMKSPIVDFRLPDGARVNIVINPISLEGPIITIRKMSRGLTSMDDLVARGTLTKRMAYFLYLAITARLNVIFAGGTASGKTTTLGILTSYIPESDRIVVIEDTAELELRQAHVVRLECRPPGLEGTGGISVADLLRNTLRMRPTRIIVGEVRGDEAFDLLNAMSSGHDGCLSVVHASSPEHAVGRLEMMTLMRGLTLPLSAIQRQIASAVHVIVQHALLPDGTRRITHIAEVAGTDADHVRVRNLFELDFDNGSFRCTGVEPRFADKLARLAGGEKMAALLTPGTD